MSVDEAGPKLQELVGDARRNEEPCQIAFRHKVGAVLLGWKAYEALLDRLRGAQIVADVLEKGRAVGDTRPLKELLEEREAELARDPMGWR